MVLQTLTVQYMCDVSALYQTRTLKAVLGLSLPNQTGNDPRIGRCRKGTVSRQQ